jgi:hypothetical protein
VRRPCRSDGEGGSAALTVPLAVVLSAVAALALGDVAGIVVARARATTAADAAALAAAVEVAVGGPSPPEAPARVLARANGAELLACSCPARLRAGGPATMVVEVAVRFRPRLLRGEATVRARARADVAPARPAAVP